MSCTTSHIGSAKRDSGRGGVEVCSMRGGLKAGIEGGAGGKEEVGSWSGGRGWGRAYDVRGESLMLVLMLLALTFILELAPLPKNSEPGPPRSPPTSSLKKPLSLSTPI